MAKLDKLPRLLKEPTGWIVILMVAGFFYMQWPTRVRTVEQPVPFVQTLANGISITWEAEPELIAAEQGKAWAFSRKGMSFLVQTAPLTGNFEQLVKTVAEQDKAAVAGAEQQALIIKDDSASYAFFDAESRIQEHQWHVVNGQWTKISVLYKPSMESRVKRAADFMGSVKVPAL